MPTLYDVTEGTKKLFIWGGISLSTVIIFMMLFNGGKYVKELFAPTPPPPPTVVFGKVPDIQFPQSSFTNNYTYIINTVTGELPTFSDRTKVYKINNPEPTLLSLKNAQELLQSLNFKDPGVAITETLFKWEDITPPDRVILYNIVSNNFTLTSKYLSDPDVIGQKDLPDEIAAQQTATDFLQNLQALPTDINTDKTTTQLFRIQNNTLIPAESLSLTHIIRIDYFQKDINNMKIYYPHEPNSIMSVSIGGGGYSSGQVIESHFTHHTVTNNSATYPIYNASEAYKKLQNGEGYIVRYTGRDNKVSLTNISLGYYLGENKEDFLLPIVVFEGSDNFLAYLPAITETWVHK